MTTLVSCTLEPPSQFTPCMFSRLACSDPRCAYIHRCAVQVVNDGEMTMWRGLGVSSWPTLAVVSPKGKLLAMLAGEGHRQDIDELLQAALEYYGEQGDLKNDPLPISLEKDKDSRVAKSPLRFPGKIATDLKNKRLFIADSSQHRIVVTDLKGNFITQIGGGGGEGLRDGAFEYAAFNRPQGLAYHSGRDLLYVADTENHAFREVNLGSGMVKTLAGNGKQGADYRGGGSGPTQVSVEFCETGKSLDGFHRF